MELDIEAYQVEFEEYMKPIRNMKQRNNREQCRANEQRYRDKNRDKLKAYKDAHKEQNAEYQRIWREKNG